MYIIGHLYITSLIPKLNSEYLFDEGLIPLMLPDFIKCHDWGYNFLKNNSKTQSHNENLILIHLLEDWYIHYGASLNNTRKLGWAYKAMSIFVDNYYSFFKNAFEKGLRETEVPNDSKGGFAHTMIEYSIDTFICNEGHINISVQDVKQNLGILGHERDNSIGSKNWIFQTVKELDIETNIDEIPDNLLSFSTRVNDSKAIHEFAYRAGIKKFGLKYSEESVIYVENFINEGLKIINKNELRKIINDCANFSEKIIISKL